jgi:hypothetical protein
VLTRGLTEPSRIYNHGQTALLIQETVPIESSVDLKLPDRVVARNSRVVTPVAKAAPGALAVCPAR